MKTISSRAFQNSSIESITVPEMVEIIPKKSFS